MLIGSGNRPTRLKTKASLRSSDERAGAGSKGAQFTEGASARRGRSEPLRLDRFLIPSHTENCNIVEASPPALLARQALILENRDGFREECSDPTDFRPLRSTKLLCLRFRLL